MRDLDVYKRQLLCDQARKNMLTRMNGFLHERSFSEGNLRYPLYTFCAKKAKMCIRDRFSLINFTFLAVLIGTGYLNQLIFA